MSVKNFESLRLVTIETLCIDKVVGYVRVSRGDIRWVFRPRYIHDGDPTQRIDRVHGKPRLFAFPRQHGRMSKKRDPIDRKSYRSSTTY